MQKLDLLRIAVGNQSAENIILSENDWKDFFLFCNRQAILGIGFSAVERIGSCPKNIMLKWYSYITQIEKRNRLLNDVATEVCSKFIGNGDRGCILKGQGVATLYSIPQRRTCGDIDIWIDGNRKDIIEMVKSYQADAKVSLHHVNAQYNNVEIECHFTPSYLMNPIADRRLHQYYIKNKERQFSHLIRLNGCNSDIAFPTMDFNLVFMLSHAYRHFIYEGLGLRHVLDYWMVLKKWDENGRKNEAEVYHTICKCGMRKFLSAMMWVIGLLNQKNKDDNIGNWQEHYPWMLCEPNEKEGQFLLEYIMVNGNFGRGNDMRQSVNNIKNPIFRYLLKKKESLSVYKHYPTELLWGFVHSVYYRLVCMP